VVDNSNPAVIGETVFEDWDPEETVSLSPAITETITFPYKVADKTVFVCPVCNGHSRIIGEKCAKCQLGYGS
jgi:hypothetical protein